MNKIKNNVIGTKMIILFYLTMPIFQIDVYAQNNSFVYMHDNKFYLQCDEFYPVIVNYTVLPIQDILNDLHISPTVDQCHPTGCSPFWRSCGSSAAEWEAELIEHFTKMEELEFNMVRLLGFHIAYDPDFINTDNEVLISESQLAQLQPTSSECYAKLEPIIMTQSTYSFQGDMLQKVIDIIKGNGFSLKLLVLMGGGGAEMLSDNYKEYLGYMANRFKDEPVIFGYDLYNEPAWYSVEELDKYESAEKCFTWYDTIKLVAPSQFVTMGVNVENAFWWDPEVLPLDFISFHLYPKRYESEQFNLLQYLERCKVYLQWISKSFSKPYIIGETGRPGIDNLPPYPPPYPGIGTEQEQAEFANTTLKYSKWYGHIGYSWWKYKDTPWYDPWNPLATENYFGAVFMEESIWEDDETHKLVGDVFINYDPNVVCTSCNHPDPTLYHSPNSIFHVNELLYGNVSDGSGNFLKDVLIQAMIKDITQEPETWEFSKAITNEDGFFSIYTSMDPDDVIVQYMVYSYPTGEYGYVQEWNTGLASPQNLILEPLNQNLLPTIPNYNNWIISEGEDITWDISKVPGPNNVVIEQGGTLTVKSKVYFNSSSKLIVKGGGKLIVDENGVLTSNCKNAHWKGIEVWGNPNQGQTYTHQGAVIIQNGGTIENALCAVQSIKFSIPEDGDNETPDYAFTGGIIITSGANFINNRVAIKFWDYDYAPSASFIKYTNFETNNDMLPGTDPKTYVIINGIDGVDIYASNFTDEHTVTSPDELLTGIETFNATFKVTSYAGDPNYFSNLKDGIRALVRDPLKTLEITNNQFSNNLRSLYISSVSGAEVTGNGFIYWEGTVPANEPSYCMYLDYCTDYTVEENDFMFNQQPHQQPTGIGLVVNNSGGDPNEIYRNNFYNLEYGILAQENNRHKIGYGLVMKCNTYEGTKMDKCITLSGPFATNTSGIASNQGSSSSSPEDMAGNLFQIDGEPNDDFDDILNEANHITYYYPDEYDDDRVIPVDFTQSTVDLDEVEEVVWSYENGCPPSDDPGGGEGIGDTKEKMAGAEQKTDSTENLLSLLIDGGNTEATQTEVDNSIPPETMQVYNDLINKSPYLSDTVISTAIEKEDVLPGAMIRDIMVANPKAAKSEKLMKKLDERWTSLPEYMKAQILQGRSIVSIREETESRQAAYKLEKAKCFNYLVRYYLNDTVNPQASIDTLTALLQNENSLKPKYKLAWLSGEQGAWSEGFDVLNDIPTQFDLTLAEAKAHSQITNYYTLLSDIAQQGKNIFEADSMQTATLIDLEANQSSMASVYARNILLALDQMEYEEPVIFPDLLKSAETMGEYRELLSKADDAPGFIKVKPNPAKDYIIIEYKLEQEVNATIEIHDISGNLKYSENFTNRQDQLMVDTRNWKAGIYIATLKINGRLIESVKVTIID